MSSQPLGRRVAAARTWTPAHESVLPDGGRDGLWPTWVYSITAEEDVDGRPLGVTATKAPGVTSVPPDRRNVRA